MDAKIQKILTIASLSIVAALLVWGLIFAVQHGYPQDLAKVIKTDISPLAFVVLMVLLPLVGFPISIFLIVAGIRFGIPVAFLLWLVALPVHTLIGYAVAGNLRPFLVRFFQKHTRYSIPTIRANREALFSFLFLAMPGLPYAVKNYLLPLTGVGFRYSVITNCIVQGILGLPFIILGKSSADMNMALFSASLLAIAALFIALRWLKSRFGNR